MEGWERPYHGLTARTSWVGLGVSRRIGPLLRSASLPGARCFMASSWYRTAPPHAFGPATRLVEAACSGSSAEAPDTTHGTGQVRPLTRPPFQPPRLDPFSRQVCQSHLSGLGLVTFLGQRRWTVGSLRPGSEPVMWRETQRRDIMAKVE